MGCANYKVIAFTELFPYAKKTLEKGIPLSGLLDIYIKGIDKRTEFLRPIIEDMKKHAQELCGFKFGAYFDLAGTSGQETWIFPFMQSMWNESSHKIDREGAVSIYQYIPTTESVSTVFTDAIYYLSRRQTADQVESSFIETFLSSLRNILASGNKGSVSDLHEASYRRLLSQLFRCFLDDGVFVDPTFVLPGDLDVTSSRSIQLVSEINSMRKLGSSEEVLSYLIKLIVNVIQFNLNTGTIPIAIHDHILNQEVGDEVGTMQYMSGSGMKRNQPYGDLEMVKQLSAKVRLKFGLVTKRGIVYVDPKRDDGAFDSHYVKWCIHYLIADYFNYNPLKLDADEQITFQNKMKDFFVANDESSLESQIQVMSQKLDEKELNLFNILISLRGRELAFLKAGFRQEFYSIDYIDELHEKTTTPSRVGIKAWDPEEAEEFLYLTGIYYKFDVDKKIWETSEGRGYYDFFQTLYREISSAKTLAEAKQIAAKIEEKLSTLAKPK